MLLLDIREPGFWREALGVARQYEHEHAVAGTAPEATASAAPVLAVVPPAATPVPSSAVSEAASVAPTPVALAQRPTAYASRSGGGPVQQARAARRAVDDPYRRVAEAWRLNGRGEYEAAWRIARTLPEGSRDPQILRLKALTALWAHENEAARKLAQRWVAREPGAVEPRLALAQAELQDHQTAAARVLLDQLATERLDAEQTLQLATLQDWAGDRAGAIASCKTVIEASADDPRALRMLARLLETDGQDTAALEVVARARTQAPDDATLELLAARLAAKLGDRRTADAGYRSYVGRHPEDLDGRLEAARHAVNAGTPELAVDEYRAVIAARGPAGLRVDLARALLAAGRYEEAEEVARDAVASDEDGPEARLALAQSVFLQGRARDAAPLFRDAHESAAHHPVDASYHPRLALAQDRDLEAYGLLGDQLEGEAPPEPASASSPADLWLLRGDVAKKRGDFRRARDAYGRAAELGAPLRAGVALERLDAATRPSAGAGYTFFADANRLEVNGGAAWAEMRPGDAALLTVSALAQVVSQDDARYTRTGGNVALSELFVTPEWALDGSLGFINSSAGGGDIVQGSLGARRYFTGGSVLGIEGYREPLLGGHEDLDPRLWNRIIDLEALGPSFAVNGGKAFGGLAAERGAARPAVGAAGRRELPGRQPARHLLRALPAAAAQRTGRLDRAAAERVRRGVQAHRRRRVLQPRDARHHRRRRPHGAAARPLPVRGRAQPAAAGHRRRAGLRHPRLAGGERAARTG
ncbi:tetratricopeptide repeat protein [Parvibaculum sp.]|uniref:tetratricopeptide repeat protein n=1 Tax=Parvibaculum sp. TaxID=2024848 RepID=UPI003BA93AD5